MSVEKMIDKLSAMDIDFSSCVVEDLRHRFSTMDMYKIIQELREVFNIGVDTHGRIDDLMPYDTVRLYRICGVYNRIYRLMNTFTEAADEELHGILENDRDGILHRIRNKQL